MKHTVPTCAQGSCHPLPESDCLKQKPLQHDLKLKYSETSSSLKILGSKNLPLQSHSLGKVLKYCGLDFEVKKKKSM